MKYAAVTLLLFFCLCLGQAALAEHYHGGVYNFTDVPVVTADWMGCLGTDDGLLNFIENPSFANIEKALVGGLFDFGSIQWHVASAGGMNSYTSPSHCLTVPLSSLWSDLPDQFIVWTAAVAFYKEGNFYVGKWPPIEDDVVPFGPLYHNNTVNLEYDPYGKCAAYGTDYCLISSIGGAPVYGTKYGALFKAYTGPLAETLMSALQHNVSAGLSLYDYSSIYNITADGSLYFSQIVMHDENPLWTIQNDKIGGPGWNTFKRVFPANDGVIYALKDNGDLVWYHNVNWDISMGSGFTAPRKWLAGYGAESSAGGWDTQDHYPRTVADVNGDGKADVVGFAYDGVYVSLSHATGFSLPVRWHEGFSVAAGWNSQNDRPRLVGDVDGDGLADVVGFAYDGVYVMRSKGTGFHPYEKWLSEFSAEAGWSTQNAYPRQLGDVNGDGMADIVGFASDGVYVSLATGTGFKSMEKWLDQYGSDAGWGSQNDRPRFLADINGDDNDDIIGFAYDGTYVSISTGSGFAAPTRWLIEYGASTEAGGWTTQDAYPRVVADVTGDGKADIIGFFSDGTWVALSVDNHFDTPGDWRNQFDSFSGWESENDRPRFASDVTGDGIADIVAFAYDGVYVGQGGALWKEKQIGTGWDVFSHVFAGSDGVVYAVDGAGDLYWYKVNNWNSEPNGIEGPVHIGSDWQQYSKLAGGDDGIIYAIDAAGDLYWYKHNDYKTGGTSWSDRKLVGSGWGDMQSFSYAGDGQFIAVDSTGALRIYKHDGYQTGANSWSRDKVVQQHFDKYLNVFATY